MSGGQRQRVAMGRAIARRAQLFLFDEPLSNLDAALRAQVRVEIKKLHQALKTTMVYVTHDQVEAMTLADRLVVLNAGAVEQQGPPLEVYRRPASRFVAAFLGSPAMNFLPLAPHPTGASVPTPGLHPRHRPRATSSASLAGRSRRRGDVRPHDVVPARRRATSRSASRWWSRWASRRTRTEPRGAASLSWRASTGGAALPRPGDTLYAARRPPKRPCTLFRPRDGPRAGPRVVSRRPSACRPSPLLVAAMVLAPWSAWAQRLTLWHAYRGNEQRALELAVDAWRGRHPGVAVEVLAMPYESYASKLEAAIPHGNGPDLFVDAHERVTSYRGRGLLRPITAQVPGGLGARFDDTATRAFTADGALWAVPLAVKCNALYVNPALLPAGVTVRSLRDLDALRSVLPRGSYPLVYESSSAYVHAAFAHAFGSGLLGDDGRYLFVGDGAERSVQRVLTMLDAGTIPEEASGALLSQLFLSGRAVAAISGPWFAAEIGDRMRYTVQPLPTVPEAGDRALEPFATVEGAMVSARASNPALAESLALDLASVESSAVRAQVGRQVVVTREAWGRVTALANDPLLAVFRQAALGARPMPVHPRMRATWEPARMALAKSLRRDGSVRDALNEGARRFADVTRPLPPRRDGTLALLMVGAVALWAALSAVRRARDPTFASSSVAAAARMRGWPTRRCRCRCWW
jgi:maltose-binding protein MalE